MKQGTIKRSISLLLALLMTAGLMTPAMASSGEPPAAGCHGNNGGNHNWQRESGEEPTCVAPGFQNYICAYPECSNSVNAYVQTLPATGVHTGSGTYQDRENGTHQEVCSVCNQPFGANVSHSATGYRHNDGEHWQICEACNVSFGNAAHAYTSGFCVCGASEPVASTTYTITFHPNGGSVSIPTLVTDTSGRLTASMPTPIWSGYSFNGWFSAANGGTEYTAASTFSQSMTLYAHWTQNVTRSITLDPNGAGASVSPTSITVTSNVVSGLPTPTRNGYTFQGWYTESVNGTQVSNGMTVATTVTTLYAHWTQNATRSITLNPNGTGATVSPNSITVPSTNVVSGLPTPTRAGYIFQGWYTESVNGTQVTNGTTVASTVTTLYAHWTQGYTITFNANGGTITSGSSTMTTNTNRQLSSLPSATRSNYTFLGWFTATADGTRVTTSTTFSSNTVLYAMWTQGYVITFNANGGTIVSGSDIMGTNTNRQLSSLPVAIRTGYTFQGWYTSATSGSQVTANYTTFSSSVMLYARWTTGTNNLTATLRSDAGVAFSDSNTTANGTSLMALFTNLMSSSGYNLSYVQFTGSQTGTTCGTLYSNSSMHPLSTSTSYYASGSSNYLGNLYFMPSGSAGTWSMGYRAYSTNGSYISGTLSITVPGTSAGSVTYTTAPSTPIVFNAEDFNSLLRERYSNATLSYVQFNSFTGDGFDNNRGYVYYNYGVSGQTAFTTTSIRNYRFYYGNYSSTTTGYPLSALTFVPGTNQSDYTITLNFTAYGSSSTSVSGTLVLTVSSSAGVIGSDIIYATTSGKAVPIRATDLENYFQETYGSNVLSYVTLRGVPTTGTLYYNYGGTGSYGSTTQVRITSSNYSTFRFYLEPSSSQYSLSALTYVPSGSDYCVSIPFTAFGTSTSRNVQGAMLIGVTDSTMAEVYAVTRYTQPVSINASAIYSAVQSATGQNLSYIQFIDLPASTAGTLYYTPNNGTQRRVTTADTFRYSGTGATMSSLSFTPRGVLGSIDMPYIAYSSNGRAIAYGNIAIGVVSSLASYTDMTSSSWYYKYVVELSDAGVINGMPDGSYAGTRAVTYGEALKLIMLATNSCGEQTKQAGQHWAKGYMDIAISRGYLASAVNLNAPITRAAVASLASSAMRLSSYPATSPFVDTNNSSILRLYEAGIVEGSVGANGSMYFYPNGTLTRAEVATIVWRIYKAG